MGVKALVLIIYSNRREFKPAKTINTQHELSSENLKPTDSIRLDEEGEKCVLTMKMKLVELID